MTSKRSVKPKAGTTDSFQNAPARVGIGTDNLLSQANYAPNPITRVRPMIENAYRGSWIVRRAVDTVPADMVRSGIDIIADMAPDDVSKMQQAMIETGTWDGLSQGMSWARLFGGAIIVLLVAGQRLDTPLRLETVGRGQFKGVCALDRWQLAPPQPGQTITEYGPDMGCPAFYEIVNETAPLPAGRIHHSRVIRFIGDPLPIYQRQYENGWGASILEGIFDRLVAFDSATMGTAQLVHRAHVKTVKIKGFRKAVATGGEALQAIRKAVEEIRALGVNEGVTVIDMEDDVSTLDYTFAGLDDILIQLAEQLAGALEIPVARLFGQSPGGLNSTGNHELRAYYDSIAHRQRTHLYRPIKRLIELVHASEFGSPAPSNMGFQFKSLYQINESEAASVTTADAQSVRETFEAGIIERHTALKELKERGAAYGAWTNITDDDIAEAEAEPPEAGIDDEPNGNEHGVQPNKGEAAWPGADQPAAKDANT